jgi:predicted flap endonuclease-1-like 5' DNA nuclease
MESIMFSSCVWWFLLGLVIGGLVSWFACRYCCKRVESNDGNKDKKASASSALLSSAPSDTSTAPVKAKKARVKKPAAKPRVNPNSPKTYLLDSVAAKAAGFNPKGPNDLTVIEGIGPKINELFNKAGVASFAQLSKQTVPQMQKVLDDGGDAYRLANPSTWAQQAELANENKWTELRELQDSLSGGV